ARGGSFGHWMANGGGWWHHLNPEQDMQMRPLLAKVAELPLIIELEKDGKKFVICHADYPHDEYEFGKPVDAEKVIWNR
ncbi:serine/threonine protein phosphatase, partial [Escherichia coli]|nr:serine/threonine protein phosphatase [Escherichia coli]